MTKPVLRSASENGSALISGNNHTWVPSCIYTSFKTDKNVCLIKGWIHIHSNERTNPIIENLNTCNFKVNEICRKNKACHWFNDNHVNF